MNREIKTKKVGRQKKLTNPCPVIKGRVGLRRYWILFCSMNARDVLFSGFLCVVSWYALNVCRKKF